MKNFDIQQISESRTPVWNIRVQLVDAVDEAIAQIVGPPPAVDVIYHYSDVHGLRGIVEDNRLWATDASYQNDASEIVNGRNIFQGVCVQLAESFTNEDQKSIVRQLSAMLNEMPSTTYLCCFSHEGDQLSQWRGYADKGFGYSIGFDAVNLVSRLNNTGTPLYVIYEKEKQLRVATSVIRTAVDFLFAKLDGGQIRQYSQSVMSLLYALISYQALRLKNSGFAEEKEFRYVIHNNLGIAETINAATLFRGRDGLLIPYRILEPKKSVTILPAPDRASPQPAGLFPIREIIIGPSLDAERAIASVKMLLHKHQYQVEAINIRKSDIPFLP